MKPKWLQTLLSCLCCVTPIAQSQSNTTQVWIEKIANMPQKVGYIPLYWEASQGKIWLEITHWDTDFLYVTYLATGLGSKKLGLDRTQLHQTRLVQWQRKGNKVFLIQPNLRFRSLNATQEEARTVQESFPPSILWGGTIENEEDGRVFVNATSLFLQDAIGISKLLKKHGEGDYQLDLNRSAFEWERTKNFPKNTEIESLLTLSGTPNGVELTKVAPNPEAITFRQHCSFVELPEKPYIARNFDPRSGFFGVEFMDFSAPLEGTIWKSFLMRHRLVKKNPHQEQSEPQAPIIYYVDRGIPEPFRTAVIEGASWWNQAFAFAGFENAFQVQLLPEDADPMDVRYNVIQWVHRETRGWSYGFGVVDPRSGEILKGHVILGSLRVRQDYLLASAWLNPFEANQPTPEVIQQMALARIRQLSAHEVGHSLGVRHNFAASVNQQASVMDYPHPQIQMLANGKIDLSKAYAQGIGRWDQFAIAYGYQEINPNQNEKNVLDHILQQRIQEGLHYLTDEDARSEGSSHPLAHLWDNGTNAIDELLRLLEIRQQRLNQFSEKAIPLGAPLCTLEEALVPLYLMHRYQIEATSKFIAGLSYTYAVRDDGQTPTEMIHPAEQLRALDALLQTLQPKYLEIPESILQKIPPRADGYHDHGERFQKRTGLTFDPFSAIEGLVAYTLRFILHPERVARLIEYHTRDPRNPGFYEVLQKIINATWKAPRISKEHLAEIQRLVEKQVLFHLMRLIQSKEGYEQVQAFALLALEDLKPWIQEQTLRPLDSAQKAHYQWTLYQMQQFEKNPTKMTVPAPSELPPGSPIGETCENAFPFSSH